MILHQKERENEEKAFKMWLMKYINMDKKTFVPFEKCYQKRKIKVSRKSNEEILEKAYSIRRKLNRSKRGV